MIKRRGTQHHPKTDKVATKVRKVAVARRSARVVLTAAPTICRQPPGQITALNGDWYCTNKPDISINLGLALNTDDMLTTITNAKLRFVASPGSGDFKPHNISLALNAASVGSLGIDGPRVYETEISSELISRPANGMSLNTLNLQSSHPNDAHYTVSSGFKLIVNHNGYLTEQCVPVEEVSLMTETIPDCSALPVEATIDSDVVAPVYGLHAEYHAGFRVLDEPLVKGNTHDSDLNFTNQTSWGLDATNVHQFSVRWTGNLVIGGAPTPTPTPNPAGTPTTVPTNTLEGTLTSTPTPTFTPTSTPTPADLELSFDGLDTEIDGIRVWVGATLVANTWGGELIGVSGDTVSLTLTDVPYGSVQKLWIEYYHFSPDEDGDLETPITADAPELVMNYVYGEQEGVIPSTWLLPYDPDGVEQYPDPFPLLTGYANENVIVPTPTAPVGDDRLSFQQLAVCHGGKVTIVPVYPGASQEIRDMQAIATSTGMIYHDGPTWNAMHIGSTIAWGTRVDINAHLKFDQTDGRDEIWYRLEDLPEVNDRWINGHARGFYYIIGASITQNVNPCDEAIGAIEEITFTYDREAAGKYALAHSYRNSIHIDGESYPGNQRVTNRINTAIGLPIFQSPGTVPIPYGADIPYAQFINQAFSGIAGATGSALFPSEAIWMGGLPMTYNNDANGMLDNTTLCQNSGNYNYTGWRFCQEESPGDQGAESSAWRAHKALVSYYSTEDGVDNTVLNQHGQKVASFDLYPLDKTVNLRVFNPDFKNFATETELVSDGAPALETHQVEFYNTFVNPDPLVTSDATIHGITDVETGDYIFINRNNDLGHGFFIVGWGAVHSCPTALSTVWKYDPNNPDIYGELFTSFGEASGQAVVPYIVDFNGMIDPASSAYHHQLQHPRPRPFYCASYNDPDHFELYRTDFAFYTFPPNVTVDVLGQIYVSPDWGW